MTELQVTEDVRHFLIQLAETINDADSPGIQRVLEGIHSSVSKAHLNFLLGDVSAEHMVTMLKFERAILSDITNFINY